MKEEQRGKSVKKENIDRLSGIIDTEDPRFANLKQENVKYWEQGVQSLCQSMIKGVDKFYEGQTRVYSSIMQSILENREDFIPQAAESDSCPQFVQQAANEPYIFQSFPLCGSKIDSKVRDPSKFVQLHEKLDKSASFSLWHEPIDILNNGPEFFEGIHDLLLSSAKIFVDKKESYSEEDLKTLATLQSEAITCLFGVAVLTANYDLIVHALDTINKFEQAFSGDKFVDLVFLKCQPALKSFLARIQIQKEKQEPAYHIMQGGNLSGVFGIANHFSMAGMTERNTSITTDGTYLYLYISIQQSSFIYRIGTGENNSTAGRVYQQVQTQDTCDVTWVYCKGKLYARKTNDPFGVLQVFDPMTLVLEGPVKLFVNDLFHNPKLCENFNKNYPLLTDGESLYIITMQVVQKRKQVKESYRAEYDLLQKKKKNDAKKASADKLSNAGKEAAEKAAKEKEEEAKKKLEEMKKKRKVVEKKQPPQKEEKPAPANQPEAGLEPKPYKELDSYRVCEFSVHQFDLTAKQSSIEPEVQTKTEYELLQNPLCFEMHQSFSGLFSASECARALKFNNDDIEAAVQWLVDEKERPSESNQISLKKSIVILESLVSVYNPQVGNNNVDVQVDSTSILQPHNITTGKWTITDGQATFHNVGQDNEVFSVFGLKDDDYKQVNKDEMLKTHQVPVHLFEKEDFAQHYLEGGVWRCMTFQKVCEHIVKLQSLKDLNKDSYEEARLVSEIQLYQPITLNGTLLRHNNALQKNTNIHQDICFITYNHHAKNFFVMMLNWKARNIAIIEDLASILPKTEKEPSDQDFLSFKAFNVHVLKWLNYVNESRFQMPWRWRSWNLNLQQVIEYAEQKSVQPAQNIKFVKTNPLTGLPETSQQSYIQQTEAKNEINKVLIKKLKKRQQKIQQKEIQIELNKLGLNCLNEKEAKEYLSKAEKQRNERKAFEERQLKQKVKATEKQPADEKLFYQNAEKIFGLPSESKPINYPPLSMMHKNAKIVEKAEVKYCTNCGEATIRGNQCKNCHKKIGDYQQNSSKILPSQPLAVPGFPTQPTGQHTLPLEKICVAIENKKMFAFCSSGSVASLECLFEILKHNPNESVIFRAILDQVAFADNLSAYDNPKALDSIYTYMVARLKQDIPIEAQQYIWRILIVGWHLFARTQKQQIELITLVVNQSCRNKATTWGENAQQSFFGVLLRTHVYLAPIVLFSVKFLQKQASFYPMEFLIMSKVSGFIVTAISEQVFVPSTSINANKEEPDQLQNADQDCQKFTPIKKAYFKSYQSEKNFDQLSNFNQSITEMPIDIIALKPVGKQSGGFGSNNGPDGLSFKSQTYFSMPLQTVFMMELVDINYGNQNDHRALTNVETMLSFVTNEKPKIPENLNSNEVHKVKYDFLMQKREENANLQDQLISAFSQAIYQSIQDIEEAGDDQFHWDDKVGVALMQSFSYLIIQAINMVDWHNPCVVELPIKAVKFAEEAVLLINKKSLGFTKQFKPHQARWLNNIQTFSQQLVNMLHLSLGSLSQTYLSVKILPSLLSIFENLRKVFNYTETKSGKLETSNMLDIFCVTNTEGIDQTYEKVFETAHPYPRQDIRQIEVIKVPRAIGYLCEFDLRCTTQNGQQDYVQIKSADFDQRISENFGTKFRSSGRHAPGQNVYLLLGKQIEIEFRASVPRQERKRPGEPIATNMTVQMLEQRWGFRINIKPIFSSPGFITDQAISRECFHSIYNRIESESSTLLYTWFMFFNMLIYLSSAYTQDLTDGNLISQQSGGELTIGSGILNEEDQKPIKELEISVIEPLLSFADNEVSDVEECEEIYLKTKQSQSSSFKSIIETEVLNWHLLKGGLNLKFCKKNQPLIDIESCLAEGLRLMNTKNKYNRHQQWMMKRLSQPQKQIKKPLPSKHSLKNFSNRLPTLMNKQKFKLDSVSEDFKSNKESWSPEIKDLVGSADQEGSLLDQVLKKIRKSYKRYENTMVQQGFKPSFKKHQAAWTEVERLLIAAMLYHSDSIGDLKKFLEVDQSTEQEGKQQEFLKEQFTMIGRQLNVVLNWMLLRLAGQRSFVDIIDRTLEKAQELIELRLIEKDRADNEAKLMLVEDTLAASLRQEQLQIKEENEKLQQEEKKQEEAKKEIKKVEKKQPIVSVSKNKAPASKGKRLNRPQMARVLPKPKEKKPAQKQTDEDFKYESKTQNNQAKAEESKHPDEIEKDQKSDKPIVKYVDLSGKDLIDLKNKIEMETFQIFTQEVYTEDTTYSSNLGKLSLFFDIELELHDPHEMLKKIFKKVKQRIEKLIDFENVESPIHQNLSIDHLNLGSPEEQVARDIKNRIMILFEINSSVNFQSEVTKIDNIQKMNTFWRNKRMATILEELEEDQQSQQQILTELSENIEEDIQDSDSSENLMPIETKRAQSVPTGPSYGQKSFSGIGAGDPKATKIDNQRKQSMDYSDWVESYRKWRLWNKKSEDEAELLSPYGSPLQSVISFAKFTKINDANILRNIMLDQQYIAFFRLYGLQMQEKLFNLCATTAFGRFVWGNQSSTLLESTLYQVETCGERMTKQLNVCSRALVTLLMGSFVSSVKDFERKTIERLMLRNEYNQQMKAQKRGEEQKFQRQETKIRQEEQAAKQRKTAMLEDSIIAEDLKKILHILNDIRVLMNNIYTREHVLESLRQDSQLSTQDSLGIDKIQAFLKATVQILIKTSSTNLGTNSKTQPSIMKLKGNLSHVSRLVLNLFITQDKIMIRQTETQRILQEMLLDITVEQLESKCYRVKNGVIQQKTHKNRYQEEQIQLLKLLCEVIRISNDNQPDQKEIIPDPVSSDLTTIQQPSADRPQQFFLSAGSHKVMRCASLLAYMLHHVEVPAVMRLTIKCASLFFKLVDLHKLKILKSCQAEVNGVIQKQSSNDFIIETLKTIGQKIANISQAESQTTLSKAIVDKPEAVEELLDEEEKNAQEVDKVDEDDENITTEANEVVEEKKEELLKTPERKQKEYYIFCNLNTPQEEDFIFVMTALFHWYSRYPNKNLRLIEDPNDICKVKKSQPQPQKQPEAQPKEEQKLPEIEKPKAGEIAKLFEEIVKESEEQQKENEELPIMKILGQEELSKEEMFVLASMLKEEQKSHLEVIKQEVERLEEVKEEIVKVVENAVVPDEVIVKIDLEIEKIIDIKQEVKEPVKEELSSKLKEKRPLNHFEQFLPQILLIQKLFRKIQARKIKLKQLEPAVVEGKRLQNFIQMLQQVSEFKNSIELQIVLASQNKELMKIQQQKEAQKLSESLPKVQEKEKRKAEQLLQPSTSASGVKQKFNNLGNQPHNMQIKIANLVPVIEALAKETYQDPYFCDNDEKKKRCVQEMNYYIRTKAILRETITIAENFSANNTVIFDGPFSQEKAMEFSDLLQQAYRGQLIPIGCNPHMTEEAMKKEIQILPNNDMKISAMKLFPITPEKLDKMAQNKKEVPMQPDIIKVAPKNFVVTVCEKNASIDITKEVQVRISEVKSLHKSSRAPQQGGSIALSRTSILKQGASQLVIIQELIQLVRSMIDSSSDSDEAAQKIKLELIAFLNLTLQQLVSRDWDFEFTTEDKFVVLGLFSVVGGWQPQIKTGQLIQVNINNVWSNATVIDDGAGKDKISVILDEDDSLQITKLNKDRVRAVNRFELDLDGDFGVKIDQHNLIEAVTSVFNQTQNSEGAIAERFIEFSDNTPTNFSKSILSPQYLLQLMLKTSSQLKWTLTKKDDRQFAEFIRIMIDISGNDKMSSPSKDNKVEVEEDKTMTHWERALTEAWERLIDKSETKNLAMFTPREFVYPSVALKRQSTSVMKSIGIIAKEEVKQKFQLQKDAEFSAQDFIQTKNSFLCGLPNLVVKEDCQIQNLKRLQFWEKNVVPELIRFCTGYYQPWEWKFGFAQLRNHLSLGQVDMAHADASMMFNQQVPANCVIPDVDHDWSPKIIDEVLSDTWLIAKITPNNQSNKAGVKIVKGQAQNSNGRSNYALLDRLLQLEQDKILVHIKLVDGRSNSVLAEYFDPDSMSVSLLWIPINKLMDINKPLPPRPTGFSNKKLAEDFEYNIQKISSVYSRQTLNKLFQAFQTQQNILNQQSISDKRSIVNLPTESLKLQELICWSVWETFCAEPIDGWLKQTNPVMLLNQSNNSGQEQDCNIMNADQKNLSLPIIVDQALDQIALETLLDTNSIKPKKQLELKSTDITLQMVKTLLQELATKQSDSNNEITDDNKVFNELVEWCVTNWYMMSGAIEKQRACLELLKEYERYKQQKPKDGSLSQDALPLHELVPGQGANANSTLILFKKNKVKLNPGSKVQLFSDAGKTDLLQEISTVGQQDGLDPLVITKGKVWLEFQEGSNCLIPIDMRSQESSSIECAIFHIPKEWTVLCWLTEVITTALVTNGRRNAPKLVIDVLSKLISAVQVFYDESRAPIYLKSIILKLLSRLIVKLRIVYIEIEKLHQVDKFLSSDHFKRLSISNEFILTILSELLIQMDTAACNSINSGQPEKPVPEGLSKVLEFQNNDKVLHPCFAQDAIEFLMHLFIPTSRKLQLTSYQDLLPLRGDSKAFSMPLWIEPFIKVSFFLHYFRSQSQLPQDLLKKVHQLTKLGSENLDNIIVMIGLPAHHELFTKAWIKNRIFEMVEKHKARVIDPIYDLVFIKDANPEFFNAVLIIDGFNHHRLIDDGQSEDDPEISKKHKIELLVADSDEEVAPDDEAAKKEAERLKRIEEEKPKEWACPICTVINGDINRNKCEMCESPAPSMEEKIAAHLEKLNEERRQRGEVIEAPKADTQEEHLHLKRLKMLKNDLRHMISDEQRTQLLADVKAKQKREHILNERTKKALLLKAEEEAKHAKEEEKVADKVEDAAVIIAPEKIEEKKNDLEQQKIENEIKPLEKIVEQIKEELKELKESDKIPVQRLNSFASSKSGKDWEDMDSDEQEEKGDSDVDLDNLPEDRFERFRVLGVDTFALDEGDNDLADMMEMSAIEELRRKQDDKLAQKEEKRKALEEERKQKEREAAKQALASCNNPVALIKVETLCDQKFLFAHEKANILVQDVLRMRLQERRPIVESDYDAQTVVEQHIDNSGDFKFSSEVTKIIKTIHTNFQNFPIEELQWPENEPLLQDLEITKQTLKDESYATILDYFLNLALADVRLLFKVFESQGFDLQLTSTTLPTPNLSSLKELDDIPRKITNLNLLSQVKRLIEFDYCDYSNQVIHLQPSEIRLLHKFEHIKQRKQTFAKYLDDQRSTKKDSVEIETEINVDEKASEIEPEVIEEVVDVEKLKKAVEWHRTKRLKNCFAQMNYDNLVKIKKDEQKEAILSRKFNPRVNPIGYFDDFTLTDRYVEACRDLDQPLIRYIWALLKTFNEYFVPAVPIINQASSFSDVPQNSIPFNIALYMKEMRDLSLNCVKTNLRYLILDKTSVNVEKVQRPEFHIDRLKIAEKQEAVNASNASPKENVEDSEMAKEQQRDCVFLKAYEQMKDIDIALFRPTKPMGSEPHIAFEIVLAGEHVVGDAGPYRAFFSNISNEIQPQKWENKLDESLGLLYPCANQRDKEQYGKDRFILSSSNLSTRKLQHFEFLGVLMGVCIRTGVMLVFDLPQITWKQLVGKNPDINDIFNIEMRFCRKMKGIIDATAENFSELSYYWTVQLADGREHDLTDEGTGGKDKLVTFEQRFDYVRRCIYTKLTESRIQCAAIRRGLSKIIPESILNLISHEEMESWVCGTNLIDVNLIRRNTQVIGNDFSPELISMFWEFFEGLSQNDRRRFVKFCYAIERLPQNDADWKRQNLVFKIKKLDVPKPGQPGSKIPEDDRLPQASTCFFHFMLPKYTNLEKMKQKITLAFTTDNETMNAEDGAGDRHLRREREGHGGNDNRSYDGENNSEEE